MEELLAQYCKRLHFGSNIVANAKAITAAGNIDFLVELFRRELDNRELKRKNAYIKQAHFDLKKTFENYSFDGIQIPASITAQEIMKRGICPKGRKFAPLWSGRDGKNPHGSSRRIVCL